MALSTTNRVRAGSHPPLQLHRAMPLDFAGDEPDEETIDKFAADALDVSWAVYLAAAIALASACIGVGFIAGRFFS